MTLFDLNPETSSGQIAESKLRIKHASHRMHANSRKAHREESAKLNGRAAAILAYLREHGPATDRQVRDGMGFADMNAVRPRLTELIGAGLAVECGSVKCECTGKTVRKVMAV